MSVYAVLSCRMSIVKVSPKVVAKVGKRCTIRIIATPTCIYLASKACLSLVIFHGNSHQGDAPTVTDHVPYKNELPNHFFSIMDAGP